MLSSESAEGDTKKLKEIIVVGGGIAGLAAARKIQNHPSQNYHVVVLEGRKSRYGGRIWVDRQRVKKARGSEADLGAMFVKSSMPDNPIFKMASDFGLTTKTVGPLQLHLLGQEKVYDGDEVQEIFKEVFQVLKSAVLQTKENGKDQPLSKAVELALSTYQGSIDKEILSAVMKVNPYTSFGSQSALYFDPGSDFGWDTIVVDGLDQLVDRIVGGVGEEMPLEIELHKVVRQIKVDEKRQKVLVRTADRTQYTADAVVIALPPGVLRQGLVLFDPPLSKDWRKLITEIGVGTVNKVILEFDKAFWPSDVGVFMAAPLETEKPDFASLWVNVKQLVEKPCLIGMLYGDAAVEFENMTDQMVKDKAIASLGQLFGSEAVRSSNITSMLRSNWFSDKLTMGPVTYFQVGNTPDMVKVFSEPVCPYIYFAGEYTESQLMCTVPGAYLSGVRAADQLLSDVCKDVHDQLSRKTEKKKVKPGDKKKKEKNKSKDTKGKENLKDKTKPKEKSSNSKTGKVEL